MSTILVAIGKKLGISALLEPEKFLKIILILIFIPLFLVSLVFALPIIIATSLPISLLDSGNEDLSEKQFEVVAMYQNAPITINQNNISWINSKKKEYSWCDDIQVNYNYNLLWQDLMSIDAVRLNQDFSDIKQSQVLNLAEKFIIKHVTTETYQEVEHYQEEEQYQVQEPYKVQEPYQTIEEYWALVTYEVEEPYEEWEYWVPNMPWYGGRYVTKTRIVLKNKWELKTKTVTKYREVTKYRMVTKTRTVDKTRTVTKTRAIITVETKNFETVLKELKFDDAQKEIALNILSTIINIDVEGNFNIYDDTSLGDLKEYPAGNANLPYYNQGDRRWGHYPYGKKGTIKTSGCGPTSLAMVVSGLTSRPNITPKIVADWSVANGHRIEGSGSAWSLMTQGGKHYGLKVESVSRKNPKKIVQALSEGYPIIASMGRGHFTKGGHFIVLRGITDDGKVLVHDPASVSRSQKAWDLSIIMGESSTNGGVNGSPFWIYRP